MSLGEVSQAWGLYNASILKFSPPKRILLYFGKLILLGGLFAGLMVLLLPYYLGALLPYVLPDAISYEAYEREGYGRFALTGVEVAQAGLDVTATRVEALTPLNWLIKSKLTGHDEAVLRVDEAEVFLSQADAPVRSTSKGALPSALHTVNGVMPMVHTWLPEAEIRQLTVHGWGNRLEVADLSWDRGVLGMRATAPDRGLHMDELRLELDAGSADLFFRMADLDVEGELQMDWLETEADLAFQLNWAGRLLDANAVFNDQQWMPIAAEWKAEDWRITPEQLGRELPFREVALQWSGFWKAGTYENELSGFALADDAHPDYPQVDWDCRFSGDLHGVDLKALSLSSPGFVARLEQPVHVGFDHLRLSEPFLFTVNGDLEALEIPELAGVISGQIQLEAFQDSMLKGAFNLNGEGIVYDGFGLDLLELEGRVEQGRIQVQRLVAQSTDGSVVSGGLLMDPVAGRVEQADFELQLKSGLYGRWLPQDYQLQSLNADIRLSGPFKQLKHQAQLRLTGLESSVLQPLDVDFLVEGALLESGSYSLRGMASGGEAVALSGEYDQVQDVFEVMIDSLKLSDPDGEDLELGQPLQVRFFSGEALGIDVPAFQLQGEHQRISGKVAWTSEQKQVELSVAELDIPALLQSWLKPRVPDVRVESFEGRGELVSGYWLGGVTTRSALGRDDQQVWLEGAVSADEEGVVVDHLQVAGSEYTWVSIQGSVPLRVGPALESYYKLDTSAPLLLDMRTLNHEAWIRLINPVLPVPLERFNATVLLEGSLDHPEGSLNLAMSTKAGSDSGAMPSVEVAVDGRLQGSALELDQMRMSVKQQVFSAEGRLDLPGEALAYLLDRSVEVDWRDTAFDFSVGDSSLTPLAYFLGDYIRAGGELSARLQGDLKRGFDGEVHLSGVSSKAVFPFGAFREVSADLVFDDSRAELQSFSGKIGREPISLAGSIDYRDVRNPAYELKLQGKGLPVVRQSGMLLRADLDLSVAGNKQDGVDIRGLVELKGGLFMLNLTDLAGSSGGQSAKSRPPYFSVSEEPFNRWRLDVDITGSRFMSLYTPALKGVVSVDMDLLGTLQEPFLNGEISFDEGTILFPFANFDISSGEVVFPVGDPYHPRVSVQSTSRRLDYDLMLEVTGNAFDPELRFDSNPPLSSEQILLLVVAGENPEDSLDYNASTRASRIGTYLTFGLLGSGPSGGGIGSRLNINSGSSLSRQGKETMDIEFMLDEDWYLIGEYDEYDAWNGGLRWRILNPAKKMREEDDDELSE